MTVQIEYITEKFSLKVAPTTSTTFLACGFQPWATELTYIYVKGYFDSKVNHTHLHTRRALFALPGPLKGAYLLHCL